MTLTGKPYQNRHDESHIADVGGSGVPLASGDLKNYIVSRIITGVALLFALSVAVFILTHVVPGDPFEEELGFGSSRVTRAAQYPDWVGRMSRGDFGYSFVISGTAVRDLIFERLPSTLMLLSLTMILAAAVSIPVGVLAAARRGSLIDRVVGGAAVLGVGVPSFWLALMLVLVLRPSWGGPMSELVLPSLVLATFTGAVMVRIIRSSIVEVLVSEDMEPPRGGGLPVRACLVHGFGNFLIWAPALFGGFLAGAILVETVFGAPGIGWLTVSAVHTRDYPVLQGVATAAAGMAVIVLGFSLVASLLLRRLEARAAARPASGQSVGTEDINPPMSIARKAPWVSLTVIGFLLVVAVLAPIMATHDPLQVSIVDSLSSPGAGHLLGTDVLGRDILSRLIYGTRSSLAVALFSLIPVAVVGGGLGLLSGYVGGKFDTIITGALDNIPAFPLLLFAILVTVAFGPGLMSLVIAVTLVLWPRIARAVRDEVAALKASGDFSLSIAINPIIALLTLHFGLSILMEATLSFLGPGNPASYTVVG